MQNKNVGNCTFCFADQQPTLFILFILSHGDADGKIMTHHYNQQGHYDKFTTKSVFHALKGNLYLENALKLIFLGVSFKYLLLCTQNLMQILVTTKLNNCIHINIKECIYFYTLNYVFMCIGRDYLLLSSETMSLPLTAKIYVCWQMQISRSQIFSSIEHVTPIPCTPIYNK
jgi:hypothetical protein